MPRRARWRWDSGGGVRRTLADRIGQRGRVLSWACLTVPLDAAWALFSLTSRLTLSLLADSASARTLDGLRRGGAGSGDSGDAVELKMRILKGRAVSVRPGTSDAQVVAETFIGRYHLPPRHMLRQDLRCIWDLGCNIGLTMAHLAVLFPGAVIVGVELDHDNATLCGQNIAPWAGRCDVIEAAIWPWEGRLAYECDRGYEYGARVVPHGAPTGAVKMASARSLNGLLGNAGRLPVDYMKMDIEGAEREVLRHNTEWAQQVRCIKVEVHQPYTISECVADLHALGFSTLVDRRHWACVVGLR